MHLVKLSAGTDSVESLGAWQDSAHLRWSDGKPRHITRMWPKREAEIVGHGSIYWVIKGLIQCRQPIERFDEHVGEDGIRRCVLVLEPGLIRTQTLPKRAFQGWRYLKPEDAPADLPSARQGEDSLPPDLSKALADIGVL